MTEAPARPASRLPFAMGLLGGALLGAAVAFLWLSARRPALPLEPLAPRVAAPSEEPSPAPVPSRWRPLPVGSPLARFDDVAFSHDAALLSDRGVAIYVSPDGETHPLDMPAKVTRVFAAGGRLFAAAESEGAPFLIAIRPGAAVEPVVLPMPCLPRLVAGTGKVLAAACEDRLALAVSRDGGQNFSRVNLDPPLPGGVDPKAMEQRVDALTVTAGGDIGVAVLQRWWELGQGEPLLWTLAHAGMSGEVLVDEALGRLAVDVGGLGQAEQGLVQVLHALGKRRARLHHGVHVVLAEGDQIFIALERLGAGLDGR
ncbi:MAG: hypothetical protein ACK4N5_17390, partial [Myxococcales bacterium]